MPRHIEWRTDDTPSSSSGNNTSAKDAHHLWLKPLHPSQRTDTKNFHYGLYPEVAKRLQLVDDVQPSTTGTIAQRPDVPASQANVPSSPRDIANVRATVERERTPEKSLHTASVDRPPIAIDHTKTNEGRLFEIAKFFGDLSHNTKKLGPKTFYQKITRCLNQVLTKKGASIATPNAVWLPNTEPPSNPNEALSQAVKSMRTPHSGRQHKTVNQMNEFADEIENWMKG